MSPIRADHVDLPTAAPAEAGDGRAPDLEPRFGPAIIGHWWANYEGGTREHAVEGTRFRASMAGYCSRSLAYYFAQAEETNPPDTADVWRMFLGQMVHAILDPIIEELFGGETEKKVDLRPDVDGSATVDVWLPEQAILIEIKTAGGYAYKLSATNFKGAPQGPKRGHAIQAAVAADALGAEEMVLLYFAMEPSDRRYVDTDEQRVTAEWTFTKDEIAALAATERARVSKIIEITDAQGPTAVRRMVADDDGRLWLVDKPTATSSSPTVRLDADGNIVDSSTTWQCGFCRYRDRCLADG